MKTRSIRLTGLPIDPSKPPTSAPLPPPAANNNAVAAQQQIKRVGDALLAHRGLRRVRVTAPKGYIARKKALEALHERKSISDAQPRSLYMYRNVLNGSDILKHFASQGLENLRAADRPPCHDYVLPRAGGLDEGRRRRIR
jgi:hypothetical protein